MGDTCASAGALLSTGTFEREIGDWSGNHSQQCWQLSSLFLVSTFNFLTMMLSKL